MTTKTVTGRPRNRKTRAGVRFADVAAKWIIACGGIGTIAAVMTVFVFLIVVVVPLFLPASVSDPREVADPLAGAALPLRFGVDEYQLLGTSIGENGEFDVIRLDNGSVLEKRDFLKGQSLTAAAFTVDGENAAFGFADGKVRLCTLGFRTAFPDEDSLPEAIKDLKPGEIGEHEGSVVTRTGNGQLRSQSAIAELDPPIDLGLNSAISLIDYAKRPDGSIYCVLTKDDKLQLETVTQRKNRMTDEVVTNIQHTSLPYKPGVAKGPPSFLLLSAQGDNVYLVWKDGQTLRFDTSDLSSPKLAEDLDLVPELDLSLTAIRFMVGRNTLVVGDSSGRVRAWFRIKPTDADTSDRSLLVSAHELPGFGAAVTSIAPSARTRMVSVGYANGAMRVYYLTNERLLVETKLKDADPVLIAALAPKDDGLYALSEKTLARWKFDPSHPESNLSSLFLPVWYEGYEKPDYVWQSSSGSDDFEPKLSLIPLVYGTLKATFYSMLFGVPLALLAAIYTSEFLAPATKARVKPAIEMMASLPSVVLGFLAGIVFAPFVENIVPQVIAAFFTVPFALLLGAHLWQLVPQHTTLLLVRYRLLFIALALPFGIWLAWIIGPWLERLLFAGSLRAWLNSGAGTGEGGWFLLLLPIAAMTSAWLVTRTLGPRLREIGGNWSRTQWAVFDLLRFLLASAFTVALALAAAWAFNFAGWDPRGTFVGTYVQRNALIVGFVMGFAVIPIIYTIADDALSTVPSHLRSASLGAGATPWQTAMRIIIPTAMSGLFSAVMIGLGRAVGETMIVLMAAGNTSIMDMNIFNGFQTLSALIATEMGEAPEGTTHYRTLFLAALTLFVLTFVVNTTAEMIRTRFRRRAYEL